MDDYVILAFIGEGSFGRVFKAKNKNTSETVALKVIRKKGRSPKDLKNLRQECDIQRKLDHPNIIRMIDSFDTETELVVVTEFAEKELHSVLAKEGCLGEEQAKKITWDLVSALYYLHSHRVLHRDLKPQNVLIDSSGKAKLCDFGLARNMTNSTHVLTSIKGTPLYMAPELIDEKPYDHQADLWSLGCIVYELMAGQPPFSTMSIMQLVRMIRHKPVQWPSFISVEAFSFLQGLLHKDPSKRMTWPEILKHPFVSDHVLIIPEDVQSDSPFTQPLTHSQLEAKQLQTQQLNTLRPNMQANPADRKTLQGQTIPSECVPLSDDDSIRATSAFSVRDSLKTDDEDIGQPISAAHAKLLTHEYKVMNNSNLVVYNLNTNMAQLLKQDQQNKMEKITEENEKPDSRKQSLQLKKEDSKPEVELQPTEHVENKLVKKPTAEPATQSFENPKSSSKSGSDISSGLSKSVPPSYKQKILQFSKDKLRFGSGNRLTRSLRRSFRFSRSWDKNKGESQRRTSEPSLEIIDKIDGISCFSKEDKDKDIEKCEIVDETSNESDVVMLSNNFKSQSIHNVSEKVEEKQPSAIEQEEWEAFLNSNIAEVMDGDVECLTQPNMVSMVVGVVAGAGKGGGRLCGTVAALLALPAVSPHLPRHTLLHILDVYLEAKVVSNFVVAVNVLMKDVKPSDLSAEERLGGVSRMLEVCVWACGKSCRAVRQFAASVQTHGTHAVFATLLSMCNESPRTVLNIISLLIMVLQDLPEYADVVEKILFEDQRVNVLKLLEQPSDALRMRVCILISLLCSFCCTALSSAMERTWSRAHKECLEALSSHCNVGLNRAAKLANKELSNMPFYTNT